MWINTSRWQRPKLPASRTLTTPYRPISPTRPRSKPKAAIVTAKAQIQAAQAQVETATINLSFTRVTSPINGIAGVAQEQVGDLVGANSGPLTTVSTLDPIKDYFTISEQEYLELQKQF